MYFIIDARKVTYKVMLPYHIKGEISGRKRYECLETNSKDQKWSVIFMK